MLIGMMLVALMAGGCPPDQVWQVAVLYNHPLEGKLVFSPAEPFCGEAAAMARKNEIIREGYNFAPLSYQLNWVSPSQVKGFVVTPWIYTRQEGEGGDGTDNSGG